MKFDAFLETVGDWGKFQKVKYTIICLTYMLPPIMVYTYSFTAAKPNLRCQNPELTSNDSYTNSLNILFNPYKPTEQECKNLTKRISISECQSCYVRSHLAVHEKNTQAHNKLEICNKYVFDKTHYKTTLVEEVSFILKC